MKCKKVSKLLSPYIDNKVNDRLKKSISEHLEQCEKCRKELAALNKLNELSKNMPVPEPDEAHWRQLNEQIIREIKRVKPKPGLLPPAIISLAQYFRSYMGYRIVGWATAALLLIVLTTKTDIINRIKQGISHPQNKISELTENFYSSDSQRIRERDSKGFVVPRKRSTQISSFDDIPGEQALPETSSMGSSDHISPGVEIRKKNVFHDTSKKFKLNKKAYIFAEKAKEAAMDSDFAFDDLQSLGNSEIANLEAPAPAQVEELIDVQETRQTGWIEKLRDIVVSDTSLNRIQEKLQNFLSDISRERHKDRKIYALKENESYENSKADALIYNFIFYLRQAARDTSLTEIEKARRLLNSGNFSVDGVKRRILIEITFELEKNIWLAAKHNHRRNKPR